MNALIIPTYYSILLPLSLIPSSWVCLLSCEPSCSTFTYIRPLHIFYHIISLLASSVPIVEHPVVTFIQPFLPYSRTSKKLPLCAPQKRMLHILTGFSHFLCTHVVVAPLVPSFCYVFLNGLSQTGTMVASRRPIPPAACPVPRRPQLGQDLSSHHHQISKAVSRTISPESETIVEPWSHHPRRGCLDWKACGWDGKTLGRDCTPLTRKKR